MKKVIYLCLILSLGMPMLSGQEVENPAKTEAVKQEKKSKFTWREAAELFAGVLTTILTISYWTNGHIKIGKVYFENKIKNAQTQTELDALEIQIKRVDFTPAQRDELLKKLNEKRGWLALPQSSYHD